MAAVGTALGLLVSYSLVRAKRGVIPTTVSQLCFLPLFIPGIAFGAAYIALYGAPIGPFPALYGTFALLVLAATAFLLPFAVQTGRAVIQQVSGDLEESARLTGAGFLRRLSAITIPLSIRGLSAGALLVFVKIVRDLSLVVLLFTPTHAGPQRGRLPLCLRGLCPVRQRPSRWSSWGSRSLSLCWPTSSRRNRSPG